MAEPRKAKSYDIRVQREGSDWKSEKQYGWGYDGQLPAEWETVKQDQTVVSACVFPGYQRKWRADRRQLSDEYQRPAGGTA